MFGSHRRKAETVDDLIRRHGRELLLHVYRGVLDRDADLEGLDNWSGYLAETGRLDEMLRLTLASREFLNGISARLDTLVDPDRDLPEAPRRMVIVSNCQGEVVSRAIQAYTGWKAPKHRMIGAQDRDDIPRLTERLRGLLAEQDVLLMQPVMADLLKPHLPELEDRIELFPNLGFGAFHPDLCAVYRHPVLGVELSGPLGPYHSSIAFHAWRVGMSAREAIDHFRAEVFEALRFLDYWDSSVQALHDEGHAAGLPLEELVERWRGQGCFMHSITHPKLFVLAEMTRALLLRLGIEPLPVEPADLLHDLFGSSAVWPVYPEIGQRLGVPGNYWFKPVNAGVSITAAVRFIDLEAFVEQSFAAYASVERGHLRCDRVYSPRYQAVFGTPAGARGRIVVPATPVEVEARAAPQARHPYSDLPDARYWRRAVGDRPASSVDPVSTPRFVLEPSTRIVTAGSCFAQNIAQALVRRGCAYQIGEAAPAGTSAAVARARQYGTYSARYGNLYTPRQLVQLIDRACGDFVPVEPPWQRADGRWADPFRPAIEPQGFDSIEALEADRAVHLAAVRELFGTMEVFVFTLGLTEAWRSRADGAVFPLAPGVAAGTHDPLRHEFVNFDAAEVGADLEDLVERLRRINPRVRILLTVSPVPLAATYEDRHVLSSTVHSKAVLRAAADTIRRRHAHVDYFPAYEIVAGHYNRGAYYAADLRTITRSGVDHVMRLFFRHYLPGAAAPAPDAELLAEAAGIIHLVCEEEGLDQPPA